MRSKILALMMLTAIIVTVLAPAVVHAQNLNSSTARLCNGLPYLCEKRFDQVTFPGNHNSGSGAGNIWGHPHPDCLRNCDMGTCASSCFFRNQGKTITQQLEFGIRYFDIDTCICEGTLVTCHKSAIGPPGIGPKISQMLEEFDVFLNLEENRNEVIVLTFGDQMDWPGGQDLQELLYEQLLRWEPTDENKGDGKLTIFDGVEVPEDTWPKLRKLVDTNQRIIVFVRNPDPSIGFENIGVLSERDHIFDTWDGGECPGSNPVECGCSPIVVDVKEKCNTAPTDKLVLISAFCGTPIYPLMCLSRHAYCCQGLLDDSLEVCREELGERIPNFFIADWTQNDDHKSNIVQVVKYSNQNILKEQGSALDISEKTASHIGFQSNRNGKMISAGIEFNTQWLTDNELWKYKKYVWNNPEDLDDLEYGMSICLQSKSNKYLRARWWDSISNGLYESNWCRGDEEWRIERYDPENPHPKNTEGFVQAGDPICLYSVQHDRYVRARNQDLKLQVHCGTDEKFYIHAGWTDSDEDLVIDEGDNCPNISNPEQEDTDEDGKGDACDTDPVADANGPYVSECTSPAGADVQLDGSGSYDPDGELIAYDWLVSGQTASGVTPTLPLALGMHDVNLVVQDDQGYTDSDQTTATVRDTIAPTVESVIATPNVLWPPNHKMVPVTVGVSASDSCDSAPFCRIVSVESSEPGGKNAPDWQITGDLTVNLRSERDGSGSGRVYTITVECTDKYGNSLSETAMVAVPHDQGKKKK